MLEKITDILRQYKENDSLIVTPETSFESLALDSIDIAELALVIEDELGVTIETNEVFKTVEDLINILK